MPPASTTDLALIAQIVAIMVGLFTLTGGFIVVVTGWVVLRIQTKDNTLAITSLKTEVTAKILDMEKSNERADREFVASMAGFASEVNALRSEVHLLTQELRLRGQLSQAPGTVKP